MPKVTHSILVRSDIRKNQGRHPSANFAYYPCYIVDGSGKMRPALFTESAIMQAVNRGESQPEDMPRPSWLACLIARLV